MKIMSGNQKFLICKICGNMTEFINRKNGNIICCGERMSELVPNTVDASVEKHKPVATISGDILNVAVGSVPHPMQDEHHITFVYVETKNGNQHKSLKIGEEPKLAFNFSNDKPIAVYAYCNLHGLWKTDI
jgi:superoxide reductase